MQAMTRFAEDESGTIAIEYGLIAVIGLGLLIVASNVGRQLRALVKTVTTAERRRRRAASDQILARACAAIDLLVKSGYDEEQAIQAVTRRMLAAGISLPIKGDWKRLRRWRADLLDGVASEVACAEYHIFTRELEGMPSGAVLDQELWDRRRALR